MEKADYMSIKNVKGENKGKIMLYTLSTCGWCKKTKKLLDEHGVEYSYIDMDLLEGKEKDENTKKLKKWNPRCSFPTIVIDDKKCIIGYKEEEIKEVLGL